MTAATSAAVWMQGGTIEWKVEPRRSLAGRNVLVLDDILEAYIEKDMSAEAITAAFQVKQVEEYFERLGSVCVLVNAENLAIAQGVDL